MSCKLTPEQIKGTTDFHGHWCPGLATGIRAAEWALSEMGRSGDEEIVAVVETDMCGVDAIQYLVSCTFGKGNLIHKDYGKNAFTFYRRGDNKAARLVIKPDAYGDEHKKMAPLHEKMRKEGLTQKEEETLKRIRANLSDRIMSSDIKDLFDIKSPSGPAPAKARIMSSLMCESCKELVMESRTRRLGGKTLCIPCFEAR